MDQPHRRWLASLAALIGLGIAIADSRKSRSDTNAAESRATAAEDRANRAEQREQAREDAAEKSDRGFLARKVIHIPEQAAPARNGLQQIRVKVINHCPEAIFDIQVTGEDAALFSLDKTLPTLEPRDQPEILVESYY
ncbi:hypothetical protein CH256_22505 [Rhodococcus sp. 05-2254-6]|uniref:hypothetical protein n=1 Tax=Rhodococcus sp. 05-2254-6 TaxID=2022489 RepID=UPI000B9A9008|nr:hypothetical protein [Rhodococcus sp. 05-2254-6]OZE22378.1 hypothetical protein CH256_22505 [Rhodococcus sp. 05-2254-6]